MATEPDMIKAKADKMLKAGSISPKAHAKMMGKVNKAKKVVPPKAAAKPMQPPQGIAQQKAPPSQQPAETPLPVPPDQEEDV